MDLNAFLERVARRLPQAGERELPARVMAEGGFMRIRDLGLDSLELLDLMMGLEEDFDVELEVDRFSDHMRLDAVFAEILRLRQEEGDGGGRLA